MNKYLQIQYLMKILASADIRYNFLQKLFKVDGDNNNVPHMSDTVTIKTRKGVDNKGSKPIKASPNQNTAATFKTLAVTVPRFREYARLTADWAYQVIPNSTGVSQELNDIIVANIQKEQEDLLKLIETSHEIMISQVLQAGKISLSYGDAGAEKFELTVGDSPFVDVSNTAEAWSGDTDKMKFISTLSKKIAKAGYKADLVIMGSTAGEKFAADEKVQKKLDNRNVNMGTMQLLGEEIGGFSYLGKMEGKDFFVYEAEYTLGNETKPFIEPGNVVVTSTMAPWEKHFGKIKDSREFENPLPTKYFSKSWNDELSGDRMLLVESDSVTACLDIASVVCAKVIA